MKLIKELMEAKKVITMPEIQAMIKASKTVRTGNTLGRGSKSSKNWGQMWAEVIIPKKVDPKDKPAIEKAREFATNELKKTFKGLPIEVKKVRVTDKEKGYSGQRVKGQPDAGVVSVIFNIKGHPHFDNKEIAKRDPDHMD